MKGMKMAKNKICFVISPIGEEESEIRKRSDQILKHVIEPPANECGYKAVRADKIDKPGIITSQVIQHVVEDPLVIADLTGRNPNVFYELAIRHAIKKPIVQIIKKNEAIPFDVAGTRTVHVDHQDLDSVEEAKSEIIRQIKAVEKDVGEVDTPISVALDLQNLRQSGNPEQRSLSELFSGISELRTKMIMIEKKLSDPINLFPPQYLKTFEQNMKISRLPELLSKIKKLLHEFDNFIQNLKISQKQKYDLNLKFMDVYSLIRQFDQY